MTIQLERRLDNLTKTLQQQVNLNDDEIVRLSDYLSSVRAEIVEVKDQLNRFNLQSAQAVQDAIGQKRCEKAQKETKIAKINADHQSYIQELQQRHANIVQQINDDFEQSLAEVEQFAQNKIIEKISTLEQAIKKMQTQIDKLRTSVEEVKTDPSEDIENYTRIQNCEMERIKNLEIALKEKNKDRLASLLKAKKHLSSCVSTLEELEQEHTIKMEKYKTQLELMDNKYDQKIQSDTIAQRRKIEQLAKKVENAEKAAKQLQKKINEDTTKQQEKMAEMSQSGDQYRMDMSAISMKSISKKENKDFQNAILALEENRSQLTQRESILYQERSTNEALKREINRLRDEAIIAQRRAALNLE